MKVVVSGGTKGIGKAIVEVFAKTGNDVAFCARDKIRLIEFRNALQQEYPSQQFWAYPCDVSVKDEVLQFASQLIDDLNTIDILINNAGIFIPGEVLKESEGVLEKLIETNLYSAYRLSRAIIGAIPQGGHIFNICSVASLKAYPNGGSYSISKFAMLGFSHALREELKSKGIKVTAVMPGATWSDSWQGVDLPEHRLMQARDIAQSVWSATQLSPSAVVEELVIRPQLGDL